LNNKKRDDSYSVLGNMGRKLSVVGAFIGERRPQENNLIQENTGTQQNTPTPSGQPGEKMSMGSDQKPKNARKSFYETTDRIQKSVWINKPLREEVVNVVDGLNGRSLPFTEGQLLRESVEAGWPAIREKYLGMLFRLEDTETQTKQS